MNHPIDVILISRRRPELLKRTFASFQQNLFQFFKIANFRINLDTFGGNEDEHAQCKEVILNYFPKARINEPAEPGFGKAMQFLWSTLEAPYAHIFGIRCICARFFTVYGPRQRPDLAISIFTKNIISSLPTQQYGDVPRTFADVQKTNSLLGYSPKTHIAEGIKKYVEWFKNIPSE